MAAQLLGDRLHLSGRDPLHIHLGQRGDQRLLGALVAFEQLGREPAVAILRHAQLELADAGDEGARVIAGAIAAGRPCARPSQPQARQSSRLPASPASPREQTRAAHRGSSKIAVDGGDRWVSFTLGHGGGSPRRIR